MSDAAITIDHHETSGGGEYRATTADGTHAGELTWRQQGEGVRVASHTGVPDSMRGQGIAAKLVDALIADARAQGFKVVPACSYVAAQFKRNTDWSDLEV